jgi:hypothetical protein
MYLLRVTSSCHILLFIVLAARRNDVFTSNALFALDEVSSMPLALKSSYRALEKALYGRSFRRCLARKRRVLIVPIGMERIVALHVTAIKDSQTYLTGLTVSDAELQALNIVRDAFPDEWNYTMKPQEAAPL